MRRRMRPPGAPVLPVMMPAKAQARRMVSLRAVMPSSLLEAVTMSELLRIVAAVGVGVGALGNAVGPASPQPVEFSPVRLEAKIPLGDVRGRIDHMAIDL